MKVIDLLNKIANGEEIPKEMCIQGDLFLKSYGTANTYDILKFLCKYDIKLNEEVEIIEGTPKENKKIEKLVLEDDGNTITLFGEKENEWTILDNVDIIVCNKINEIIDKINTKK